jgi:hypothetical protein
MLAVRRRRSHHALGRDILKGAKFGLAVATALSLWAVVLRVTLGPAAFAETGFTLRFVVMVYYGASAIGGGALGALLPLRRSALGACLIGVVFVLPFYAAFFLAYPFTISPKTWWIGIGVVMSLVVGGGLGLWVWSSERK